MIDVPGDPAAMREAASVLWMRAETLIEVAVRLDNQVESLAFEGPAADEFSETMLLRKQTVDGIVQRLMSLSDLILQSAAQVEEQLRSTLMQESHL